MGKNHPETITTILNNWLRISQNEIEALSQGDTEELTRLIALSKDIQKQLDQVPTFQETIQNHAGLSQILHKILENQSNLIEQAQKHSLVIKTELSKIKKQSVYLKTYNQGKNVRPKFLNKHT